MARKLQEPAGAGLDPNAWMVTFSDLLTLLLTFFVMLLSMSSMDRKSVQAAFSFFPDALGVLEKGTKSEVRLQENFLPRSGGKVENVFVTEELLQNLLEKARDEEVQDAVGYLTKRLNLSRNEEGRYLVTFNPTLRFLQGTAELFPHSRQQLMELAQVIREVDVKVQIEGHADQKLAARGTYASAWVLGMARAMTVLHLLQRYSKLDPSRFSAGSHGSSRPAVSSLLSSERARNERVDVLLARPDEGKSETRVLELRPRQE